MISRVRRKSHGPERVQAKGGGEHAGVRRRAVESSPAQL
jgi:hypothetical protein